jgi:hypothetical protein
MAGSISGQLANEWRARLDRYQITKWTIAEFCVIEGVSISSFYHWRKKLECSPSRDMTATRRAEFAPIRLIGSVNAVVQLPGGTRLEIPMSDSDAFERAIEVLVRADARRAEESRC